MTEEIKYITITIKLKGFKQSATAAWVMLMLAPIGDLVVSLSEKANRPEYPTHMVDHETYKVSCILLVNPTCVNQSLQLIEHHLSKVAIDYDVEVLW